MSYDDVELEFQPEALDATAGKAIERGIGARGLRAVLEEVMTHTMYDVPSDPTISKVIITAESVNGKEPPELVRDREKADRPKLGSGALHSAQGGTPMRDTAS